MKAHIISAITGALLAIGAVFFGGHYIVAQKTVVLNGASLRVIPGAWRELEQKQVDALTAELKKMGEKKVTLVCVKAMLCETIQLDFENAFESAHWETITDTLVFGSANGLIVNDKALGEAITRATGFKVTYDDTMARSTAERVQDMTTSNNSLVLTVSPPLPRLIIGRNMETAQ